MPFQLLNKQLALLHGRLYSGNLTEIQFKIESALDRTQTLTIDLNSLEKFDHGGAYMLYIVCEKARENNKKVILKCQENEIVQFVFSYLGIHYADQISETSF